MFSSFGSREWIDIGSSPYDEPCVQVSTKEDYLPAMKAELRRFKEMLEKRFTNRPEGAVFGVRWSEHDFGRYGEVVVYYDEPDPTEEGDVPLDEALAFALFAETHAPNTWDDETVFDWQVELERIKAEGLKREESAG